MEGGRVEGKKGALEVGVEGRKGETMDDEKVGAKAVADRVRNER